MAIVQNILPFAHHALKAAICEGDVVVDATAGNGHDTLFLAQLVGETGKVWAFDVQEAALKNTQMRLQTACMHQRVQTVLDSHARIADYVCDSIAAAVFNFGYLPGGDKSITTQTQSSIQAVEAVLSLLKEGGVAVLVLYPGHEEGAEETAALKTFIANLPQKAFNVAHYAFLNRRNAPPQVVLIEKIKS